MKRFSPFVIGVAIALSAPFIVALGAQSTSIVISEFRARGPLGINDEFVELHNQSSAPIDISTWQLQGSTSLGVTAPRRVIPAGTIIQPGCFYLLTNGSAGGYSGRVPGDARYTIGLADDGGVAITLADGLTVVDQVGMSAGSAFKEGTPLASLGTDNIDASYERKPDAAAGFADTDVNADDYQAIAPSRPRNRFSPCSGSTDPVAVGGVAPNPVLQFNPVVVAAAVTPGTNPDSTGLAVFADLSDIGGPVQQQLVDDGTSGDALAGDGIYSYTLQFVVAAAGAHAVTLRVTDFQERSSSTVVPVIVDTVPGVSLPHDVQGPGLTSPLVGQSVIVEGVVTALKADGFFLQTAVGLEDADPASSEGVFVYAGLGVPAGVNAGSLVRVVGTVNEVSIDGLEPWKTQVNGAGVVIMGAAAVPPAVPLTAADLTPSGGTDQLERFESMHVSVGSLTSVSPTRDDGSFYAVLTGTPRPTREPGVMQPLSGAFADRCASGPPCAIPVFDTNPERLRVDTMALGASPLQVTSNVIVTNLTAILDSGSSTWTLLPLPNPPVAPAVGAEMPATAVTTPAVNQFTVASLHLGTSVNRIAKAALVIRTALKSPDILVVQDAEDLTMLQAVADAVNLDAGTPSEYRAYLEEGNDPTGVDVGLLVRARVSVTSVVQEGKTATFTSPDDGGVDPLYARPPLVVRATVDGPATTQDASVIVVATSLTPLDGVDSSEANVVRARRQQQAEFLATLLDGLQEQGAVISIGDYNAFEQNDGFVDVMGTVRGMPAAATEVVAASPDLVEPNYTEATNSVYSQLIDGNLAALDHALLSSNAQAMFASAEHARINADFSDTFRDDPTRVERLSDRDPLVTYFEFPAIPVVSGAMSGIGRIAVGAPGFSDGKVGFIFHVEKDADGERGWLVVESKQPRSRRNLLVALRVASVSFSDAHTVTFSGTGWWNGRSGYSFEVTAVDGGTTAGSDSFSITVRDRSGVVVLQASGPVMLGGVCAR